MKEIIWVVVLIALTLSVYYWLFATAHPVQKIDKFITDRINLESM